MLLSAIFAAIPASAAEAEKAAIDFTKLDYVNRDWKSKKAYTDEEFAAWITAKAEAIQNSKTSELVAQQAIDAMKSYGKTSE